MRRVSMGEDVSELEPLPQNLYFITKNFVTFSLLFLHFVIAKCCRLLHNYDRVSSAKLSKYQSSNDL